MTDVKQLAKILRTYDLSRVEYECNDVRIVLERSIGAPDALPAASEPEASPKERKIAAGTAVTAPLVGVAYRSREPGSPPLAEVGQSVKRGDAVAVIEAMKVFSEIPAPCDGVVLEVLFDDGAVVEYGASLVIIG